MARKTNSTETYTDKNGNLVEYQYFKIKRKVAPGVYKTFRGKSEKEAKQKYENYIKKLEAAAVPLSEKTLSELMIAFIQTTFVNDSRYKQNTKQRYIDAYNRTIAIDPLSDAKIKDIKAIDLQAAYNRQTCAPSTIDQCNKLLKLFYNYLDHNDIARNITGSLVIPGKKNDRRNDVEVWTQRELYLILSNLDRKNYMIANYPARLKNDLLYSGTIKKAGSYSPRKCGRHFDVTRIRALLFLLAGTGARISEALALEWSDVLPDGIRINKQIGYSNEFEAGKRIKTTRTIDSSTKSASSDRIIPVSDQLRRELLKHKAFQRSEEKTNDYKTNLIFTTKSGKPYDRASLRKTINRYYERINVTPRGFHCYRHTYGSRLAKSGAPIQVVSKLLGHDSIETTGKYYVHIDHEQKKAAANMLRLI